VRPHAHLPQRPHVDREPGGARGRHRSSAARLGVHLQPCHEFPSVLDPDSHAARGLASPNCTWVGFSWSWPRSWSSVSVSVLFFRFRLFCFSRRRKTRKADASCVVGLGPDPGPGPGPGPGRSAVMVLVRPSRSWSWVSGFRSFCFASAIEATKNGKPRSWSCSLSWSWSWSWSPRVCEKTGAHDPSIYTERYCVCALPTTQPMHAPPGLPTVCCVRSMHSPHTQHRARRFASHTITPLESVRAWLILVPLRG
jgi:hypothetical protein